MSALVAPARAAFLRVDSDGGGDYLTIQAAMAAASPGDTIAVRSGSHIATDVDVVADVQLLGGWNAAFTSRVPGTSHVKAQGNGTILRVIRGNTAATFVDGFELSRATQGAIWCSDSDPTISNNDIHDNRGIDGGGIHCEHGASPVIEHNHIHHNDAQYGGGIRSCFGSGNSPAIRHNLIEYNTARMGGGVSASSGSPIIEDNVIRGNENDIGEPDPGAGIHIWQGSAEIRRNLIVFNHSATGGGIGVSDGFAIIESNTLWGNGAYWGGALFCEGESPGEIHVSHNILGGSVVGSGVYVEGVPAIVLECNCVYGNAGGAYEGIPPGVSDILQDPAFCDFDSFALSGNSPCAPSGVCGLIGAFGVGCGPVAVEARSWGKTKASYR